MSVMFKITDDYNVELIYEENNIKKFKYIEVEDLIKVLKLSKQYSTKKTITNDKILFKSPVFPSYEGVSVIQYIIKSNDTQYIVLKMDKGTKSMTVKNILFNNVHVPACVFVIKIFKSLIQTCYIACVKDEIIDDTTKMFRYPFGNVYSDCRICFGNNDMALHKTNDLMNLHSFPSRFFMMNDTGFNWVSTTKHKQIQDYVKYLTENEFDEDTLIPCQNKFKDITYKDFIDQIIL